MEITAEKPGSLLTRVYYRLKPFLPVSIRWALRRQRAQYIRSANGAHWPISEAAAVVPPNWPGWPQGKRFAFVLTHDVEGGSGVEQVQQLASLERDYGFHSSFNFIPEGSYTVPVALREWLAEHGFEVGVHDLNHDGRLYDSRRSFSRKAKSINRYLNEWDACGFRSGFMLRQLDWLHDLDVAYDASTFDTDPFEPQPDGARTIFPFWIRNPRGEGGYVELPYTLPQDSTLFLLLEETSPEVWLRKLDWIAEQGGMALINIHPDYIDFGIPHARSTYRYPARMIEALLSHVRDRYGDDCWNPLPRALASWFRDTVPESPLSSPPR